MDFERYMIELNDIKPSKWQRFKKNLPEYCYKMIFSLACIAGAYAIYCL